MNEFNTIAHADIYLDTRREAKDSTYPVRLRVTYNRKTKYYTLNERLTHDQFINSYLESKPKKEYRHLATRLRSLLIRAENIIREMSSFSFPDFERYYFGAQRKKGSIWTAYEDYIQKLAEEDQYKTSIGYASSMTSLRKFFAAKFPGKTDIAFNEIKPQILQSYENWMVKENGAKMNTVSMYLRSLRTIFNIAIDKGEVSREVYPFGKRRYQVPATKNVKRALSKNDLAKLFTYDAGEDIWIEKARDFWFFSYQCNGINVRDIVSLRYGDLNENTVSFIRAQTRRTSKHNQRSIVVPRTDYINRVVAKYGTRPRVASDYVFPVLRMGMTEEDIVTATQNFTRFINQHMKRLAKQVGVTTAISTYWARHTFATNAIRAGASMEYISESLGHADLKTTQNYWSGFEEHVKRDLTEKLMDFN